MSHHTPLISTIVVGLVLAFILGALAQRLRISPLVGYLIAGILMGPFTPGYVADQNIANQLAEIGVILLMFGVGLHFSLDDLLEVKDRDPGRARTDRGCDVVRHGIVAFSRLVAWRRAGLRSGVVGRIHSGPAARVAGTPPDRDQRGRIAVGWLIVEDIAMVLALVMLPVIADAMNSGSGQSLSSYLLPLVITLGKVTGFVVIMLMIGRRVIPWILHYVAHTGSRELFRLAVLAIALGVAFGATTLFDVSFALGAFFAGMICPIRT